MGGVLRRLTRVRWPGQVLRWLEIQVLNRSLVELDSALRFVSNGRVGELYNRVEFFVEGLLEKLSENPDDYITQYCIDHDGFHPVGEEWQNVGQCNLRKCVGQNTMKHWTCAKLEEKRGCKIVPGSCDKPYPACCDQYECEASVETPVMVHRHEHRWTYEHFDLCDERF